MIPAVCPHCTADLSGGRVIGINVQGVYDGILLWCCPDCDGRWHRWPEGTRQRAAAEQYLRSAS